MITPPADPATVARIFLSGEALKTEDFDCQACGACCAYSEEWPRFSLESDEDLAKIPEAYVSADLSGMRCESDRCVALEGTLGLHVGCRIYALRPIVCRDCMPGDPECLMARDRLTETLQQHLHGAAQETPGETS
ncbi:zinc/iron-chelating domain-containing protein [Rhizobium rhizosphaerae]|uniref:Zinc/iron-chelating domain-containing protein n=1 Tax=Xaviernesmea rhizosphaerae TaxID=1672749 RepID=A0ABX3PAR2_9HYPH|nr:zinc/iron-chelating domain-containing protein [Xaviernesmea rhizosphaerae]